MNKPENILEIIKVLDAAMYKYPGPGPGLKVYRGRDLISKDKFATVGFIWIDLPIEYVTALTGVSRNELRDIHRFDHNGHVHFGWKGNRGVVSLTLYGKNS